MTVYALDTNVISMIMRGDVHVVSHTCHEDACPT